MSFRRRMILLAAGAVAAAIVIASVVVYVVTRNELQGQLDSSLRAKITPGRQLVKIESHLSQHEIAQLTREGVLPALLGAVPSGFGVFAKAGGPPAPLSVNESVSEGAASPGGGSMRGVEVKGGVDAAVPVRPSTGAPRSGASGGAHALQAGGEAPRGASQGALSFEHRVVHVVPKGLAQVVAGQVRLVLQGPAVEGAAGYVQLSLADGEVLASTSHRSQLPIDEATRAVAAGRHNTFFSDVDVHGTPVRVLTSHAAKGAAWQVALPLGDLNSTLGHLRLVLAFVCLGGVALAAALGLFVSRAALVPVRRLTGAAESVARTQDLGHRIEDAGDRDELGRLADSFNTMLAALERSRQSQRQLVSDASHELRTPLTSVQANLDALALGERLPAAERARILDCTRAQLYELTVLVGDLIDLSKTDVDELDVEDVRLDLAVTDAIERARLHAPHARFDAELEPCLVRGSPRRLDRAISNLLDNAIKWSPSSSAVEPVPVQVLVHDGCVEVRDHGPGIDPEDLPRVFDRFYRAPAARGRPGSGIGLAIVRQVAETHGGAVRALNDRGGGARLILELPAIPLTDSELGIEPVASRA